MAHALRRISYATCEPQHAQFSFLAREPRAHFTLQYCHSFITESAEQVSSQPVYIIHNITITRQHQIFLYKISNIARHSDRHRTRLSPTFKIHIKIFYIIWRWHDDDVTYNVHLNLDLTFSLLLLSFTMYKIWYWRRTAIFVNCI